MHSFQMGISVMSLAVALTILALIAVSVREARSSIRAQPASMALSGFVDVAAVVALIGSGVAIFAASWVLNNHVAPRHIYPACALTVVALVVGLGRLLANPATGGTRGASLFGIRSSLGSAVQLLVALTLAVGFVATFRVQNAAGRGPNFPAEVASARAQCSTGVATVSIRISPLPTAEIATIWQLVVPCARLGG